jgi:very-short-patch-repair endonuclease
LRRGARAQARDARPARRGAHHRPRPRRADRSKFERTFFAALRRSDLPQPIAGHPIPPYTADFAFVAERVVVETDGWAFHGNRFAFEDDRARDAFLAAHGWIVVRITWRRLKREPMLVMVQLAQTLAHRASTLHAKADRPRVQR